jgi:hypothetical protein
MRLALRIVVGSIAVLATLFGALVVVVLLDRHGAFDAPRPAPLPHAPEALSCLTTLRPDGQRMVVKNGCNEDIWIDFKSGPDRKVDQDEIGVGEVSRVHPNDIVIIDACYLSNATCSQKMHGNYFSSGERAELDAPPGPNNPLSPVPPEEWRRIALAAPEMETPLSDEAHREGVSLIVGEANTSDVCSFVIRHHPLIEEGSPDAIALQCFCDKDGDLDAAGECTQNRLPNDVVQHCTKHPTWCLGRLDENAISGAILIKALNRLGVDTSSAAKGLDRLRNNINFEIRKTVSNFKATEKKVEKFFKKLF